MIQADTLSVQHAVRAWLRIRNLQVAQVDRARSQAKARPSENNAALEVLQEQTGLDAAGLEAALSELEHKPARRPWIVRDKRVLWIRNGLRFDPTVILANGNHLKAVRRAVAALPASSSVVRRFRKQYAEIILESPPEPPFRSGWQTGSRTT